MLKTFSSVTPFIKFDPTRVIIDNLVFKFHYRWTFIILIVATILVTSQQYIGEHIKCISDTIPSHVINTYCFFTPTFTLVRHLNNTALRAGSIFQPGIGPHEVEAEPIKRHAYYQWVPFVLFSQALTFYVPRFLWKAWEGGRVKSLVFGLRMVGLTQYLKNKSLQIGNLTIPSLGETEARVKDIRRTMIDRMRLNQSWGAHLVMAEVLNLLNVILQIYLTNMFLGGAFYTLGFAVLRERWTDKMDVLDVVFPKVTKCHFQKFGPSGSLQLHDTLCVMALNIINEKIYAILWFWYAFLFIVTALGLIWRVLTLFFYKSNTFSKVAFYWAKPGRIDEQELDAVIQKCNFSNWMFLFFLRTNLSEFLFKKIIFHLASEFPDPTVDNSINERLDKAAPSHTHMSKIDEVDYPLLKHKDSDKVE
ncbi:innexin inx7-like [Teleopsis dalmanni]|uniref:innexin inx7-like n=1 Tax=Teleopsis dalmanni TaxID=139649 RepID=UPI0018CDEB9E|nr:innexin inx7-like [Teleopsis dalmanni]XP_037935125.1 innexin inx7-like [Teleopsis dalmanni]